MEFGPLGISVVSMCPLFPYLQKTNMAAMMSSENKEYKVKDEFIA